MRHWGLPEFPGFTGFPAFFLWLAGIRWRMNGARRLLEISQMHRCKVTECANRIARSKETRNEYEVDE